MKRLPTLLLSCIMISGIHTVLPADSNQDYFDILKTGSFYAVSSLLIYYVGYSIPYKWQNVSEPTAGFIRTTWKEQGFANADNAILKEIPNDSFMAKVVVYTQELPGGLAVGAPFIKRVELLLSQRSEVEEALQKTTQELEHELLQHRLQQIEEELNECRFVCGHERVHQERNHAYHMLLIQCCTPFIVCATGKYGARLLDSYQVVPLLANLLRLRMLHSAAQIGLFWLIAHVYEQQADLHASKDPHVLQAGIRLFKRAQQQKVPEMGPVDYRAKLLSWVIKYTHPVLQERIWYLTLALKKAGHESSVSQEVF